MNLQALILLVVKTSIVLSVFALGLEATFTDAMYLFRRPTQLARAFLSMNIIMPLLALLLVFEFDIDPAVKIAVVALSVSPVPPVFPKSALKAGGKENYTIGLLVAMSVLAIAVVPLTLKTFESIGGIPLSLPVRSVAIMVFSTVFAPLLAGVAVHSLAASFAQRLARPLGIVASVLLIVAVVPVLFFATQTILSLIGNGTLVALTAFALVGLISGYFLGGPEPSNRHVLSLATATRHPGIAVAIAHANFPHQKLAIPAVLLYLIVSAILSGLVKRFRPHSQTATPEAKHRIAA
jgi:bile acid:Na+ symporter, BASS family